MNNSSMPRYFAGEKIRFLESGLCIKVGTIRSVERLYKEVDHNGAFVEDGELLSVEQLKSLTKPYNFNVDWIKYEEKVFKFFTYNYIIHAPWVYEIRKDKDKIFTLSAYEHELVYQCNKESSKALYRDIYEFLNLRGQGKFSDETIYAYDVTSYRNLVGITDDNWLDEDINNTNDEGFISIYESEIILTKTKMPNIAPEIIMIFEGTHAAVI